MSWFHKRVSGARIRTIKDGFDLDLSYICKDRIIVMSYPASGMATLWRNNYNDIIKYLDKFHNGKYWIFNCCEEVYDK